jgi:Ca2+-binding RTX toxin-like protein
VTEGDQVIFTITRSGLLPTETVYFSTLADGTATYAEGDYATTSGGQPANIAVSFASGETSKTVTLDILEDGDDDSSEQFRAIVQRNSSDPVTSYLDRSGYVTIDDVSHSSDPESPGWLDGVIEYLTSSVKVAQAAENTTRHFAGFRSPVGDTGLATETPSDNDGWYSEQDLGTRYFGEPGRPLQHPDHKYYHLGEDWNHDDGEAGKSAMSVYEGQVARVVTNHPGFGNVVVIEHTLPELTVYSLYAHLQEIDVVEGTPVHAGDAIGLIGDTGPAGTPSHLHFEMFSMAPGILLSDYLDDSLNQHWGYSHNLSEVFGESAGPISTFKSYPEAGFTWYNPSIFIEEHKDEVILNSDNNPTTITVGGDGSNAIIRVLEGAKDFVLSWFERIRIVGGENTDNLNLKPLSGTTIEDSTVFFDGGAGDDVLNGSQADRRIVADGGVGDDILTGGLSNDSLSGNEGNDVLNGKAGVDQMDGGADDDLFQVDNSGDRVLEAANNGTNDRVYAWVTYSLMVGSEVEVLRTSDAAAATPINLTGNEFVQILLGNAGANVLNGKGGADTARGLGGDDAYFVDVAGDKVQETVGNGTNDRIYSGVSYALSSGSEVEVLRTTDAAGTAAINLTGNEFKQTLLGNAGANTLDGKGAADTMRGLEGNDIYRVDDAGDRVLEVAGGGTSDKVLASVSYTLAAGQQVESLATNSSTGTAAINLTGNELGQSITGNARGNVLKGGAGADTLRGLGGADNLHAGIDDVRDRFIFTDVSESGTPGSAGSWDQILEFDHDRGAGASTSDVIDLRLLDGNSATPLRFVTDFSAGSGQVRAVDAGAHVNVQIDLDGDNSVDMVIQALSIDTLTARDFLL